MTKMVTKKPSASDDYSDVGSAAIALRDVPLGYHVGIMYGHNPKSGTRIVHLEFHHRFKDELPPTYWTWVPPDIDPVRLASVAAMCRLAAKHPKNRKMPYGFAFGDSGIDEKGAFFVGGSSVGLTCATFVLAVFRRSGVELLDVNTWQAREEDESAWRALLVALEKVEGIDAQHIAAVKEQTKCMRYRPEEVAGASVEGPRPIAFNAAKSIGAGIGAYRISAISLRE